MIEKRADSNQNNNHDNPTTPLCFRLVVDRESGKPKGYGFCETAASARRNLQGYEINGRQLRVDYAENDKGVDRNREQGRGGPGLASNFDSQKQTGGPVSSGDPSLNQPIGLAVAAAAASVMAGALGDPQTSIMGQNQNAVQSQSSAGGNDPLTIHLASMSKSQLYEVLSDMKALIQQNQQQARQILVVNPQLPKALFQSGSNPQTSLGIPFQKHSQPPPLPNQPPPQQPYQMGSGSSAGTVSHGGSDAICQGSAQSNLPSSAGILSTGPGSVIQGGRGSNFVQGLSSMGPDVSWSQVLPPSGGVQYSTVPSGMGEPVGTCGDLTTGMTAAGPANVEDGNARAYPSVVGGNVGMTAGSSDGGVGSRPTPSQGPNQIPVEGMPHPQQQASQGTQLPPELESALLQQVMSLTEEQINSLPPEQRQQVLQLQRMLR